MRSRVSLRVRVRVRARARASVSLGGQGWAHGLTVGCRWGLDDRGVPPGCMDQPRPEASRPRRPGGARLGTMADAALWTRRLFNVLSVTDKLARPRPHERMRLVTPEPAGTQGRRLRRRMDWCAEGASVTGGCWRLDASHPARQCTRSLHIGGRGCGASQHGRTYLAHVVLHKAGHASGSVGTMWHVTATRVSPAGQVGRVVELVVITPDGSALISVSARCSALAKFSSSALPRTKYVAAARAMLRGGETDAWRGY